MVVEAPEYAPWSLRRSFPEWRWGKERLVFWPGVMVALAALGAEDEAVAFGVAVEGGSAAVAAVRVVLGVEEMRDLAVVQKMVLYSAVLL